MENESKKFLYSLLETPSPTGFEERIQRVVRARMKRYADSIETDLHGNVIVGINPKAKPYYLFDGYAHLSSGLACGLAGLAAGMAIGIVGDAGVR